MNLWRTRSRILLLFVALVTLFGTGSAVTPGMAQDGAASVESGEAGSVSGVSPPRAAASDPLPPPSFQRAYLHVFLAFAVAWALLLGYIVLMNRRLAAAERDLRRMAERRG